jgi:hypothetical protein
MEVAPLFQSSFVSLKNYVLGTRNRARYFRNNRVALQGARVPLAVPVISADKLKLEGAAGDLLLSSI